MNTLGQIYEKLFLGVEQSLLFHRSALPKVTFLLYKAGAGYNVKVSLRKEGAVGLSQGVKR